MIFVLTFGILLIALGNSAQLWERAPSSLQMNTTLQPVGHFVINSGYKLIWVGLVLTILAVTLARRK